MELELRKLRKPVRELRKSLKSLPLDPPVEVVHRLRTRARRVEAIAATMMPGGKKQTRRLLKALRPVRKAAGEVRDMDVLSCNARSLAGQRRDHSLARLLEGLQAMRTECARELLDTFEERRKDAQRGLKRFSRQIEDSFRGGHGREAHITARAGPHGDAAAMLLNELRGWPEFNAENLHDFRIKVKELRYVLQLTGHANLKFVKALEKVKEQIGDWHDWRQLARTAEKLLDSQDDRAALRKIGELEGRKYHQALAAAQALQARYFSG
jgi:CHAD domain-containing protein